MHAVMCLRAGAKIEQTREVLQRHGVHAKRMHPGVADAGLARWYELGGADDAALQAAVAALQTHPAVDAALVKPADETPG